MPKNTLSFAVLDVAEKDNYLAKARKTSFMQARITINIICTRAKLSCSTNTTILGKQGKIISAVKFKKNLDNKVVNACYLRRLGTDLYPVWLPDRKKITTTRISDFVLQQEETRTTQERIHDDYEDSCNDK